MGRSRRPPARRTDSESDEGGPSRSVIFLSSSDDEEANKDLSLEIVERARKGEWKRKRKEESEIIVLSTDSSEDIQMNFDRSAFEEEAKERKKKKKKSKGKKKKPLKEVEAAEAVDAVLKEEEPVRTADSVITEVNENPDNAVLRKLLRGPRYFDPGDRNLGACFNCGEEGHTAVNCTMEKRKKPCFVCGMFGHIAKRCTQGQDCFICKRRGHIAKNCPDRHNQTPQDSVICLRCGDLGHDMLSCKNDYTPEDLKEIQCYVCKNYGHLCCVDFVDNGPQDVSCYNCAQSGHTGLGCAKSRGEMVDDGPLTQCYKCGEEGHFARGCTKKTKFDRWGGGSSTSWTANENVDPMGYHAAPHDLGKARKKKKKRIQYEGKYNDRWNMTGSKSRIKGGWVVDDPGDLSRRERKASRWRSLSTSTRNSCDVYSSPSGGQYSTPQSPFRKHRSYLGTPNSNAGTSSHRNGYSSPRYYGKSQEYFGKT